jgi:hypothetical protein
LHKVHDPEPLWVARERRRAELLASLHAAEASLARGEGKAITRESMDGLARDVMERNRHRFPAGRNRDANGASPRAVSPPRLTGRG